jgi:hypothetical protein
VQLLWQVPSLPQVWQGPQPPLHCPVWGLHVWQLGQTVGTHVPLTQRWHGGHLSTQWSPAQHWLVLQRLTQMPSRQRWQPVQVETHVPVAGSHFSHLSGLQIETQVPLTQRWHGPHLSLQVPVAGSQVWQPLHFGIQPPVSGLQTWQASQPPLQRPVAGSQVWHSGHGFGRQMPSAQIWQALQVEVQVPVVGLHFSHLSGLQSGTQTSSRHTVQGGQGFGTQVPVAVLHTVQGAQQTSSPLGPLQSRFGSLPHWTHVDWHWPRWPGGICLQNSAQAAPPSGSSSARTLPRPTSASRPPAAPAPITLSTSRRERAEARPRANWSICPWRTPSPPSSCGAAAANKDRREEKVSVSQMR